MKKRNIIIYLMTLYMFFANNSTIIYAKTTNLTIDDGKTEITTISETATASETSSEATSESGTEQTSQETALNDSLGLTAESAILIDAKSGIILYDKNCHTKLYPASITKILTSLIAIEYGKYDEQITHSHNAVYGIGPGSSHIGMRENEQITLDQALYGILLASANEVCMAVAEHIDGTVDDFVEHMNKRAEELGALDSHFANPHGFHDDDHYTTCYDMAQIMKEAIKHEEFVKYINTVTYTIPPTNIVDEQRVLNNSNKLILPWSKYYYEYCVGSKTGFTDEAGNTLVTYAKKDDIELISVVMKDHSTSTYDDTKTLLNYGFDLYEDKDLFSSADYSGILNVIQNYNNKIIDLGNISVIPESDFTAFVPNFIEKDKIKTKASLPQHISAPVKRGDKVGTLQFTYDEKPIGSVKLVSNQDIDATPETELLKQEKKEKFFKSALNILKIVGIASAVIVVVGIIIVLIIRQVNISKRKRKRFKNSRRLKMKIKE